MRFSPKTGVFLFLSVMIAFLLIIDRSSVDNKIACAGREDLYEEENECDPTPTPTPEIENLKIADIDVDKRIYNPKSKNYENEVKKSGGSFPYVFQADDKIKFKVVIENVGEVEIVEIKLYDYLPEVLTYHGGNGDYNEDKNMIEFGSVTLKPGERKSYEYEAKLNKEYGLNWEECTENYAEAEGTRDDNNDLEKGDDNASFCIEAYENGRGGAVLGDSTKEEIQRLPTTGAADIKFLFAGIQGFVMGGIGLFLKKLSKSKE